MTRPTGDAAQSSPGNLPDWPLGRRGLLVGAGVAGAAALAVKALPGTEPAAAAAVTTHAVVGSAGGYRLSAHVLRYYETTRA